MTFNQQGQTVGEQHNHGLTVFTPGIGIRCHSYGCVQDATHYVDKDGHIQPMDGGEPANAQFGPYCLDDAKRAAWGEDEQIVNRKDRSVDWTGQKVLEMFCSAEYQWNYAEFCKRLDLGDGGTNPPDSYAWEKWMAFKDTAKGMRKLGTFFARIIGAAAYSS